MVDDFVLTAISCNFSTCTIGFVGLFVQPRIATRLVAYGSVFWQSVPQKCQRALQNQPPRGASKPASLWLVALSLGLTIGNGVTITVLSVQGDKVKIGIVAPSEVPVHRQEIYERIEGYSSALA